MGWMELPGQDPATTFTFFELFSGQKAVSTVMSGAYRCFQVWTLRHAAGYAVACYDIEYEPVSMNYLGAPGFVSLGPCCKSISSEACTLGADAVVAVWPLLSRPRLQFVGHASEGHKPAELCQCTWQHVLSVGAWSIMHGQPETWLTQPRNPDCIRLSLCLLLAMSRNATWVVEQPSQSLLKRHRRMEWVFGEVAYVPLTLETRARTSEVHSVTFWMMHHGSGSSKRTVVYSNMAEVAMLDLGVLKKSEKEQKKTRTTTRGSPLCL